MNIAEESQLPPSYAQRIEQSRAINFFVFCLLMLNISLLLQENIQVKIMRESMIISFVGVVLGNFLLQTKSTNDIMNRQRYFHPFFISTILIGGLVLCKVPYYSVILTLFTTATFFYFVRQRAKDKQTFDKKKNLLTIMMVFISLVLLKDERKIELSWKIIGGTVGLIFFGLFLLSYARSISWYRQQQQIFNFIYSCSRLKYLINSLSHEFSIINLIFIFLKNFVGSSLLVKMLAIFTSVSFVQLVIWQLLRSEIILYIFYSRYGQHESVFRVHQRSFLKLYEPRWEKTISWAQADCLLCDRVATTLFFPCGHLCVCQNCKNKMKIKQFNHCILCGEIVQSQKSLRLSVFIYRQGYHRKFFIEKKLFKNQYALQ